MRKSNYDKMPATVVDGTLWKGWESIRKRLAEIHAETNGSQVWVVECYQGVHHEELMRELQALAPDRFINTRDLFKSAEDIEAMTYPYRRMTGCLAAGLISLIRISWMRRR